MAIGPARQAEHALSSRHRFPRFLNGSSLFRSMIFKRGKERAVARGTMSATLREAEDAIRRRFVADGFRGTLEYASDKVIETQRWWYIPFCWIGCLGFIVSKDDLYVNWLGSGVTLEQCFWGHDRGVFCDLVDFAFARDTDPAVAERLLRQFKHMHANARGVLPSESVWYRDSEIPQAVSSQFPVFIRHFVWFAIPELMRAYEKDGLRFTCGLSKEH
jgi:hypothetical protein